MKKVLFALSFMVMTCLQVFAQTTNITGTVTDATDGSPIPGVSVFVKGTTVGTVTNIDGQYTLSVPEDATTLVFSFVGMTAQEIAIAGQNKINVVLESDAVDVGEVVVTGYGVTKKAAFTGAASTVRSEKISNEASVNPIKALTGTVAGLQMNTASGQPGASSTIYIRGRNSLNSRTQPLYVIDGVPIEAGRMGTREKEGQEISPLSSINSDDIESVTVLKDATATSIYGARAANGVIVITTKKAKAGSNTKVSFSTRQGWEELPSYTENYEVVNSSQFNELQVEGWQNFFGISQADAEDFYFNGKHDNITGPLKGYAAYYAPRKTLYGMGLTKQSMADTNWLDEVTRKGSIQEYNLSIQSSGKDVTSPLLYTSFGYLKNDAIIKGKDFERYSFRFNYEQTPIKWIKYGINSSLTYTKSNMGTTGGYFGDPVTQAYMQAPVSQVKKENGDWNFDTVNGYNPVAQKSGQGDVSETKMYRAIVSPYLKVNFTENLIYTSRMGVDFIHVNEFGTWSFLQPQGNNMRGFGESASNDQTLITVTNTLNYLKTFDDAHNVNVLFGQEISENRINRSYLSASNYPVPDKNMISLAATPSSASTDKYELKLASFFANAQYDYQGKYYLSASFRRDGSSRFGQNNRWGNFYSFGAKYRISAEDFMSSTAEWLNNLTIRSSYGTSGNQEVGITSGKLYSGWYASQELFGYGYNYNSNGGSSPEQVGNRDLKWEQTAKFNVGIDATFLSMFDITFDYYNHTTKDMVFKMPLSRTSGYADVPFNIGELENKGFEFSLTSHLIRRQDLSWNVTLVGGHNKNEITKLSTKFPIENTYTIKEVGHDIFQFKMKEFAGVDPKTGSALYYLNETGDETTTNYNAAKKRYVGTASPDFQGSFSTDVKYKNFDLAVQLNYSVGSKIYGSNLRYDEQHGGSTNNATTKYVYKNRWQKEGDITDVPKFQMFSSNKHSSQFLMDGDYLKIQNITLGYTLPKNLVKKMKLANCRVYTSVSNLYTFTKDNYRGFDPASIGANGIQWWNYPVPRTYIVGVNLNF